jgi:uncharacterized protein (DUF2236 family)
VSSQDREELWSDARSVGVRLGVPLRRSPEGWDGLMAYWARMLAPDGPIQVTPTARRLAPLILRPPLRIAPGPLGRVPAPIIDLLDLPGLSLLPPRIRKGFGIPWGRGRQRIADALSLAIRAWVRIVPASWRAMSQARAAERRVESAGSPQEPRSRA